MGWVQEIMDLIGKLKFHEIVYEFHQALYFRNGVALEKRNRWLDDETRRSCEAQERSLVKVMGYSAFLPFRRPKLPEEFVQSGYNGFPVHKDRFSKVLRPGFYLHLPIIDDIVTQSKQEKVLNLGNITVPTTDNESKVVVVSCNLRYEMHDFYKAYTAVHDYEDSLKDHTLSILAKHSRGKAYSEWKDTDVVSELEEKVLADLREVVTEKWGLEVHKVYITDNVKCTMQRMLHEGPPVIANVVGANTAR